MMQAASSSWLNMINVIADAPLSLIEGISKTINLEQLGRWLSIMHVCSWCLHRMNYAPRISTSMSIFMLICHRLPWFE